jgi:hypothetical protein
MGKCHLNRRHSYILGMGRLGHFEPGAINSESTVPEVRDSGYTSEQASRCDLGRLHFAVTDPRPKINTVSQLTPLFIIVFGYMIA